MKIYTKTGDEGQTSLYGGKRVPKDHIRIESYGTVDELNSNIGFLISSINHLPLKKELFTIQDYLFVLGSHLAADPSKPKLKLPDIGETQIKEIESWIDCWQNELEPLKTFILPGGSSSAAIAHICRTVCRRAERNMVSLNHVESIEHELLIYINRLSDYLFVIARFLNKLNDVDDIPWEKGYGRSSKL